MGSVCTIAVADYPLGEIKSDPPDDWISFFAPSDFIKQRRLRSKRNPLIWGAPNAEDSRIREFVCEYRIPAWVARDRLDLFGYTVDAFDAAATTPSLAHHDRALRGAAHCSCLRWPKGQP